MKLSQAKSKPGSRSANEIDKMVGTRLRDLRTERGLTLQELAAEIGISHQQLQKYETGTNRISAGLLPFLAAGLGIDLIELFEDMDAADTSKTSEADKIRNDCQNVLRRTKSAETLASMLRVLKALAS